MNGRPDSSASECPVSGYAVILVALATCVVMLACADQSTPDGVFCGATTCAPSEICVTCEGGRCVSDGRDVYTAGLEECGWNWFAYNCDGSEDCTDGQVCGYMRPGPGSGTGILCQPDLGQRDVACHGEADCATGEICHPTRGPGMCAAISTLPSRE